MNRIVFICPYFGTIPKGEYKLWLKSCEKNETIDFILITNDEEALSFDFPTNVKPIKMSWEECRQLIHKSMDFELAIVYAYKLCDFRPAYGEIFNEYIKGYDFWGHTDSGDTILGNLRKFLTEDILNTYDKIHIYGHMSLFRNTPENNARYKIRQTNGLTVEEIFSAEENMCFDDMYQKASINRIFKENGFAILEEVPGLVADVLPHDWNFRLAQDNGKHIPRVFEWREGELFELTVIGGTVKKREIGYVHFQKRNVVNKVADDSSRFYLVPNEFIDADHELTAEEITEYSKGRLYLAPLKNRVKRLNWYINHPKAFMRKVKGKLDQHNKK